MIEINIMSVAVVTSWHGPKRGVSFVTGKSERIEG
jgi:hypothetical protein